MVESSESQIVRCYQSGSRTVYCRYERVVALHAFAFKDQGTISIKPTRSASEYRLVTEEWKHRSARYLAGFGKNGINSVSAKRAGWAGNFPCGASGA